MMWILIYGYLYSLDYNRTNSKAFQSYIDIWADMKKGGLPTRYLHFSRQIDVFNLFEYPIFGHTHFDVS